MRLSPKPRPRRNAFRRKKIMDRVIVAHTRREFFMLQTAIAVRQHTVWFETRDPREKTSRVSLEISDGERDDHGYECAGCAVGCDGCDDIRRIQAALENIQEPLDPVTARERIDAIQAMLVEAEDRLADARKRNVRIKEKNSQRRNGNEFKGRLRRYKLKCKIMIRHERGLLGIRSGGVAPWTWKP